MISIEYITGFFDGEGSLILRFRDDKRYKTGVQITPHINITNSNKDVLDMIQSHYGFGKIYWHKRDCLWYLNIYKIDQLIEFTSSLIPYSIVKEKEKELGVFLNILKMMKVKKHLSSEGLLKIFNLWEARNC